MFAALSVLDLDDVFAYKTSKTVVIKDRVVGITAFFLHLVIFAYILTFSMLYAKSYLTASAVTGTTEVKAFEFGNNFERYKVISERACHGTPSLRNYTKKGGTNRPKKWKHFRSLGANYRFYDSLKSPPLGLCLQHVDTVNFHSYSYRHLGLSYNGTFSSEPYRYPTDEYYPVGTPDYSTPVPGEPNLEVLLNASLLMCPPGALCPGSSKGSAQAELLQYLVLNGEMSKHPIKAEELAYAGFKNIQEIEQLVQPATALIAKGKTTPNPNATLNNLEKLVLRAGYNCVDRKANELVAKSSKDKIVFNTAVSGGFRYLTFLEQGILEGVKDVFLDLSVFTTSTKYMEKPVEYASTYGGNQVQTKFRLVNREGELVMNCSTLGKHDHRVQDTCGALPTSPCMFDTTEEPIIPVGALLEAAGIGPTDNFLTSLPSAFFDQCIDTLQKTGGGISEQQFDELMVEVWPPDGVESWIGACAYGDTNFTGRTLCTDRKDWVDRPGWKGYVDPDPDLSLDPDQWATQIQPGVPFPPIDNEYAPWQLQQKLFFWPAEDSLADSNGLWTRLESIALFEGRRPTYEDYEDAIRTHCETEAWQTRGLKLVVTFDCTNMAKGNGESSLNSLSGPWMGTDKHSLECRISVLPEVADSRRKLEIVFLHTGQVYWATFGDILVTLTSSLALLAVANVVTEVLMLMMPLAAMYKQHKFEYTADFSEVREELEAKAKSFSANTVKVLPTAEDDAVQRLQLTPGS